MDKEKMEKMEKDIKAALKTAGVKKKVADLHALQKAWRAAEKKCDNKATRAGLAAALASMRAESKDTGEFAARSTVNADGTVTVEPAITVTVVLPADETVKIQNDLLTGLVGTVDPTAVLGADEIGELSEILKNVSTLTTLPITTAMTTNTTSDDAAA
jgi:hypothetical protein